MRIIVCVKQVPDTRVPLRINPETSRVEPADIVGILNPPDVSAIEQAVRIVEHVPGEVILISLGPIESVSLLRQGLALGANRAILVRDDMLKNPDAQVTAMILAQLAKSLEPSLVFCGTRSLDNATGQVGAGIAEAMDIPHVSGATFLDLRNQDQIIVHRKAAWGYREKVECLMPALITVDNDLNQPRYPTLPALIDALVAPVEILDLDSLSISREKVESSGSRTRVASLTPPRPRPKRIFTPSSSLNAKDRINAILSGGISQRESYLLEGSPRIVVRQIIELFIEERILTDRTMPDRQDDLSDDTGY